METVRPFEGYVLSICTEDSHVEIVEPLAGYVLSRCIGDSHVEIVKPLEGLGEGVFFDCLRHRDRDRD